MRATVCVVSALKTLWKLQLAWPGVKGRMATPCMPFPCRPCLPFHFSSPSAKINMFAAVVEQSSNAHTQVPLAIS